jgi:arsenical pump membrane protein
LDLLAIAAISAVLANLLNNLPAILILAPALAPAGAGAVLAALIGVNIGPNLTYVGSLATLLWRRILRSEDADVHLGEFLRLGGATVPAAIAASTLMLWSTIQVGI